MAKLKRVVNGVEYDFDVNIPLEEGDEIRRIDVTEGWIYLFIRNAEAGRVIRRPRVQDGLWVNLMQERNFTGITQNFPTPWRVENSIVTSDDIVIVEIASRDNPVGPSAYVSCAEGYDWGQITFPEPIGTDPYNMTLVDADRHIVMFHSQYEAYLYRDGNVFGMVPGSDSGNPYRNVFVVDPDGIGTSEGTLTLLTPNALLVEDSTSNIVSGLEAGGDYQVVFNPLGTPYPEGFGPPDLPVPGSLSGHEGGPSSEVLLHGYASADSSFATILWAIEDPESHEVGIKRDMETGDYNYRNRLSDAATSDPDIGDNGIVSLRGFTGGFELLSLAVEFPTVGA